MKKLKDCFAGRFPPRLLKNTDVKQFPLFFQSKSKAKNHFTYQILKNLQKFRKSMFLGQRSPGHEVSNSSAKYESRQKIFMFFRLFDYFSNSRKPLFQVFSQKLRLRCRGKNGLQTILRKRVGDRMKITGFPWFSYDLLLVNLQL